MAASPRVDLASIDQPRHEIGMRAAKALLSLLAERGVPMHVLIESQLVVRPSFQPSWQEKDYRQTSWERVLLFQELRPIRPNPPPPVIDQLAQALIFRRVETRSLLLIRRQLREPVSSQAPRLLPFGTGCGSA